MQTLVMLCISALNLIAYAQDNENDEFSTKPTSLFNKRVPFDYTVGNYSVTVMY